MLPFLISFYELKRRSPLQVRKQKLRRCPRPNRNRRPLRRFPFYPESEELPEEESVDTPSSVTVISTVALLEPSAVIYSFVFPFLTPVTVIVVRQRSGRNRIVLDSDFNILHGNFIADGHRERSALSFLDAERFGVDGEFVLERRVDGHFTSHRFISANFCGNDCLSCRKALHFYGIPVGSEFHDPLIGRRPFDFFVRKVCIRD